MNDNVIIKKLKESRELLNEAIKENERREKEYGSKLPFPKCFENSNFPIFNGLMDSDVEEVEKLERENKYFPKLFDNKDKIGSIIKMIRMITLICMAAVWILAFIAESLIFLAILVVVIGCVVLFITNQFKVSLTTGKFGKYESARNGIMQDIDKNRQKLEAFETSLKNYNNEKEKAFAFACERFEALKKDTKRTEIEDRLRGTLDELQKLDPDYDYSFEGDVLRLSGFIIEAFENGKSLPEAKAYAEKHYKELLELMEVTG